MALLFCDGFDFYATGDIGFRYGSGSGTISGGNARNGVGGVNASSLERGLPTTHTTVITGFAFYPTALSGSITIEYRNSGSQCYITTNSNGSITAFNGNGATLGSSAAGVVSVNTWHFLEFKALINNSTGTIEVRVNGATVLNLTSQDTQNTANAYATEVRFGTGNNRIDDLYICDDSGSVNNDFLGDIRVDALFPTADGTNTQWSLSTGSDHYALVDDATPNGDTDYIHTDVAAERDTFVMQDVSALGGSIKGVQLNVVATKDGTTTRGIKPVIKSSATYSQGTEKLLSNGSYTMAVHVYEQDPNISGAWTESTVNAMEAGVDLST